MSQQNNSHPLTEEIINEFREKFVAKAEDAEDPEAGWDGWKDDVLPDEVQAFLLSSLTRVREDERRKHEQFLGKMAEEITETTEQMKSSIKEVRDTFPHLFN